MTDSRKHQHTSAAVAGASLAGVEAYRSIPFDQLPADVIKQLRTDGTRGDLRDLDGAREVYHHNVPAEAKGSVDGVRAVTNDPTIDWMHRHPYDKGGSNAADNGVYGSEHQNQHIYNHPMTDADVQQAHHYIHDVAVDATPGTTGDLGAVATHTVQAAALGGVFGGGLSMVNTMVAAQGLRDSGRADLAEELEGQIATHAVEGAANAMVRGTAVAATQAILGANPVTAAIGAVVPDAVMLLTQSDKLSEAEIGERSAQLAVKAGIVTAAACCGPIGWLGLAGYSLLNTYNQASAAGQRSRVQQG